MALPFSGNEYLLGWVGRALLVLDNHMPITIICQRAIIALKRHCRWRAAGLALLALLGLACGGCLHIHENTAINISGLGWAALGAPPPADASPPWLLAGPLSLALALAYAGRRLLRARRAAEQRIARGRPLEREDLALARTARDALALLVRRQMRRWGVVMLEELRRGGKDETF
jgi:hypothetical protein